jgi:hypothetical protein
VLKYTVNKGKNKKNIRGKQENGFLVGDIWFLDKFFILKK